MQRIYEMVVVLDPQLEDEGREAAIGRIKDFLSARGGEVLSVEHWGVRRLAYEIRKRRQGYYILFFFRADGSIIPEFERNLHMDDAVLRHLIVVSEEKEVPVAQEAA